MHGRQQIKVSDKFLRCRRVSGKFYDWLTESLRFYTGIRGLLWEVSAIENLLEALKHPRWRKAEAALLYLKSRVGTLIPEPSRRSGM